MHILTLLQNFRTFSKTLWRHLNCSWCHPTLHVKKKKIRLWGSSVNQAIKNNKSFNRSTKFKYNNKLTFSLDHCFILKIANIALYLNGTSFRGKYLSRTLFLCLQLHEDETNIYTLSSKPHKGLAICRAKAVSSFLSYFKTLSIGLVPRVEPRTSRSRQVAADRG